MVTDPIADYLTRIRNAVMANHRVVEIPKSKIKVEITKILFEKGYILNYKVEDETRPGIIKIALKYHPVTKLSALNDLTRISKPGLRKYVDAGKLPRRAMELVCDWAELHRAELLHNWDLCRQHRQPVRIDPLR